MSIDILANYINGEFVTPNGGTYLDDLAPATGNVIARIPRSDSVDAEAGFLCSKF